MSKGLKLHSRFDQVAIAAALIVFLASVTWLTHDYYAGNDSSLVAKLKPIGKIKPTKNQVRRKHDEGFTWYDIRVEKTVYLGDFIFTGQESGADITLEDGSVISLSESSLVALQFDESGFVLDLQFGGLSGDLKGKAKLKVAGEFIETNGAKFDISKAMGGVDLNMIGGKAKWGKNTLKKGRQGLVDGSIQGIEEGITLVKPGDKDWIWLQPEKKALFKWNSKTSVNEYTIEVSHSPNFETVLYSTPTQKKQVRVDLPYFQTPLYWRVMGSANNKRILSPTGHFQLQHDLAPQAESPTKNAQIVGDIRNSEKLKGALFTWKDRAEIWNEFWLQVATDSKFANVIHDEKNIPGESKELIFEKTGDYYWRVRGKHNETNHSSPWSVTKKFFIRVISPDPLAPPVLISKNVSYNILPNDLELLNDTETAIELSKVTGFPKFDWAPVESANHYKLTIANDPAMKQVVSSYKLRNDYLNMLTPPLGKYHWSVQAVYKDKTKGPMSEVGTLHIRKPSPVPVRSKPIVESIDYAEREKPSDIKIAWNRFPVRKGYEIQWSNNPQMKNFERKYTTKKSYTFALKESGKVYWKVRASNRNKTPFSPFSPIQTVTYERTLLNAPDGFKNQEALKRKIASTAPPIDSPKIIQPTQRKIFLVSKNAKPFILLKWSYPNDFDNFEIQVSKNKDFSSKLMSKKTNSTKMILEEKLEPGIYYWRVRALRDGAPRDWTSNTPFKIKALD